jgi:hypothetical protein
LAFQSRSYGILENRFPEPADDIAETSYEDSTDIFTEYLDLIQNITSSPTLYLEHHYLDSARAG